ncbi:hypothetical protein GPECTOR_2g1493 [Gonium pectorale]|uniref:Uncharacterized protein n=1 Tax=Gonium pectorale TaxID=33097 RepID=A0A150H1U4_GONPE|nr:hypothetical protein GPECTOR_2g1493 [Gonium pectorale]|eukprot:KXZ55942.1 hypothetical protein GPECTOR_2g1493 [Gonium pectorale]
MKPVTPSKPAYSFGGKNKPARPPSSPGPGAYEPSPATNLVKPTPNVFSIANRNHGSSEGGRSPGPADCSPEFKPTEPHAASLKSRHENLPSQSAVMVTPGPGEYDTPQRWRPWSQGKTFGVSRSDRLLANGMPGPGEYGSPPLDPYRPRRASWTIGRSVRGSASGALRGLPGPGPGTYEHDPNAPLHDGGHSAASDHRSAPAWTFGGKPFESGAQRTPGPADYGVPRDPGAVSKPAFTLRPQTMKREQERTPGPGAYEPGAADGLVHASAPLYSCAERVVDPGSKDVKPGPGHYDPKEGDGRIAVSVKFPQRVFPPDHIGNPAPHDYADKDFRGFAASNGAESGAAGPGGVKGFTMRPRYPDERRERVPGPQYAVGVSTLGVGASATIDKSKLDSTLVL